MDAPTPELTRPPRVRPGAAPRLVAAFLPAAVLVAVLWGGAGLRGPSGSWLGDHPALSAWVSVFLAIALQSLPFLVLGVTLSAALAAFVPPGLLPRLLPRRAGVAVPAAGLLGVALPGCECASVPIAGRLVAQGVTPAAALTFLLASPAINPVVLVSTAVAFGGDSRVVAARFGASLVTSVLMGWWWLRLGRDDLIRLPAGLGAGGSPAERFTAALTHDVLHAGGFLVLGGAIAAACNVLVPRSTLDALAANLLVAMLTLAVFAVVVAVCSEADAFVAASMTAFPLTARLAFMVVGPAIDAKLFAMQVGAFGPRFAVRFAPMTLLVALGAAFLFGQVLL